MIKVFEMYNKFPASFTDFVFNIFFLQQPYKKEWPNGTVQNLCGYE